MATQPLRPAFAPAPPHIAVAHSILDDFRQGRAVDRERLRALFTDHVGASDATDAWAMRQAYDALELAQVLFLLEPGCPLVAPAESETLTRLTAFAATRRFLGDGRAYTPHEPR